MNDSSTPLAVLGPVFVVLYLAIVAAALYLYVRIARKAGYSGWWVAALFVPIFGLVVMVLFAVQEWPIERRLAEAEARAAFGGAPGAGAYGRSPAAYGSPPTAPFAYGSPYPTAPAYGQGPAYGNGPVEPQAPPSAPTFDLMPYPAGYGPPPVSGAQAPLPPPPAPPAQRPEDPFHAGELGPDAFNTGTSALPGTRSTGSIPIYGQDDPPPRRTF